MNFLGDFLDFLPTTHEVFHWFVYDPEAPLLFNSALFLGLFLVFYLIYILIRKKFRGRLLYVVVFSLFFYYKSSGIFFLLLVGTTIVDYFLARLIDNSTSKGRKKFFLTLSILSNLGILAYFKYTNFFIENINRLNGVDFNFQNIILPVGISFYTFQSISYIVEVYRKEVKALNHFLDYIFYISFFPQLVAGPIVKAKEFIPQIYKQVSVSKAQVNEGLLLIVGGLIKKAVISDYISINFVDRVFDAPNMYSAFENLMATYGYALQIYCDFSGYSDMAIGIGLLLGYQLPVNFRTPYQSASITEFWRRWHISLSTWLKEFLYIPTGGNRNGSFAGFFFPIVFFVAIIWWSITFYPTSPIPLYLSVGTLLVIVGIILLSKQRKKALYTNVNLMTTMLLGGLWHGASLRFIIWGFFHGFALAVHKFYSEIFPKRKKSSVFQQKIGRPFAVFITFNFVCFCWVFFRAKDFNTALAVLNNIEQLKFEPENWWAVLKGYGPVFSLILIGYIWHFLPRRTADYFAKNFSESPLIVKGAFVGLIFWVVFAMSNAGVQPFIYFQF